MLNTYQLMIDISFDASKVTFDVFKYHVML